MGVGSSLPLPLPQAVELFEVFLGYAAVMDDQHVFIVGISGMLGGVEVAGDYYLASYDEGFMVAII